MKKIKRSLLGCLCGMLLLALMGCGELEVVSESVLTEIPKVTDNRFLYITEMDTKNEAVGPIQIDLSEYDEEVMIDKGGEYILTGSIYHPVKIDVHEEIVHLFLDGVNIQTTIGPTIEVTSAGKVIITLMQDSINTFYDAAYYSNEDLNAAISANCDLTINGSGVMYVCGIYKDAIHSKDVLKVLAGQVQVKAKRYGLRGNDGIVLDADAVIVESENNGCQTSKADNEGKGIIDIRGGKVSIVAGKYALSSAADVYIRDGEVNMNSVIADIYAEGQQYIAEGTISHE